MVKRLCAVLVIMALGTAAFGQGGGEERFAQWESVGPGGGGGNFNAAVSPYDTSVYFGACDMGGFYRSADAGATWRMLDGISHTTMTVVFDPADTDVCYVAHRIGAFMNNGWALSRSDDLGETWAQVYGFIGAYETNEATCLAIDPDDTTRMFTGMRGVLGGRVLRSDTGGHAWEASDEGIAQDASVLEIVIMPTGEPGSRTICAVTDKGPYLSTDDGRTWKAEVRGLPTGWRIVASSVSNDVESGKTTIYIATEVKPYSGGLMGGIYRSEDGKSWRHVSSPIDKIGWESQFARIGRVAAIAANDVEPATLYAAIQAPGEPYQSGVWKTADGGATWEYSLPGPAEQNIHSEARGEGSNVETGWLTREFSWGWGGPPDTADQLYVCKSDPDIVLGQDDGRTIGTRDGGATWQQLYCNHVEGNRWTSRGYEVTTCYKVYWNPADHDKMFIAYTDIGFFRSEDRGESWIYALRGSKHTNTVYDLAIDPVKPDTMWAAVSSHHDMPEWKTLVPDRYHTRGGVSMTTDGAKTWQPMGGDGGLPNSSVGGIILDPKSAVESRRLYVTSWGRGVYKSTDGGRTWQEKNKGINTERDYNFWRMAMATDGTLYVITTKIIEPAGDDYRFDSGAIYRSDDGAESWKLLARGDWMAYPWDVACDPVDPNVVYVATKEDPHVIKGVLTRGGLYKSADRGETWANILEKKGPQRITIEAANPKCIYVTTEDSGVYRTTDGGIVWNHLEGPPFTNCIGVSIDPDDRETVWVTTFGGGVWKGSAYGSGFEAESGSAGEAGGPQR